MQRLKENKFYVILWNFMKFIVVFRCVMWKFHYYFKNDFIQDEKVFTDVRIWGIVSESLLCIFLLFIEKKIIKYCLNLIFTSITASENLKL